MFQSYYYKLCSTDGVYHGSLVSVVRRIRGLQRLRLRSWQFRDPLTAFVVGLRRAIGRVALELGYEDLGNRLQLSGIIRRSRCEEIRHNGLCVGVHFLRLLHLD